ncbi:NAD-dependent DNA ligase LigA [Kineothrix sedimenti]|uniref:DNA ligase n=1 Tax=Kineothrix sedimenti TaxID=3123317 RepID=A0ABZ3F091_9FIRM
MNKVDRINELVEELNKAANAYYKYDNLTMTDKQYDDLYDELFALENETGYILTGSPTQKVQGDVVDFLVKVEHKYPMLSSNKTKDLAIVRKFIGDNDVIQSWKLDGLTVVAEYKNGMLYKAVTRGNGIVGEDVTHTFKHCINLPVKLREPANITFRGECVIPWGTFEEINSELEETYSHPRNLAAGTLRQLDANIAIERKLEYYVFDVVDGFESGNLIGNYAYASDLDMPVVEHCMVSGNLEECFRKFNPENFRLPVDGLIYRYDDTGYGKSLGTTSHHPLDMLAFKWQDQLYETILTDIEWNTSKTGLINPVAIFNPVDLEGAVTTRATLHNVSYIEDLELGIGDTIQIYRSNMVIPKVHANLTKSNTWMIPDKCPCCGGEAEIHNENGSKTLHCCNDACTAKLLARIVHFCSKNAINIEDMSEATIEFVVNKGWIRRFKDIYDLKQYTGEWIKCSGFGQKSVYKLIDNIEKSRNTALDRFIYSLSIPLIGKTASKTISKYLNGSFEDFFDKWINNYNWTLLDDFGATMNDSMNNFILHNCLWVKKLADEFVFNEPKLNQQKDVLNTLDRKTFVITGSVNRFKNRDELKELIESLGGKVSGSVSTKTDFLINNDSTSNSGKNKKAFELRIPVITEEEFMKMINY